MKFRKHKEKGTASRKALVIAVSLMLIACLGVGGTLMYLTDKTGDVKNTFTPAEVTCQVTENFDGSVKSNVNAQNTGDVDAYIRIKLVSYRVDSKDISKRIGGSAAVEFTPGTDWVLKDGYYYYTSPVAPGGSPEYALIDSITLEDNYDDQDGGRQVIEVIAEAIQAEPATAVEQAWGVNPAGLQ